MTAATQTQIGFQKRMPATLDEIDVTCGDIKAWLMCRDLAHEQFGITLLAREALVNAVVYGAAMDARRSIEVRIELERGELVLSVEDPGQGFAWRGLLGKEASANEAHGRGIMIFNAYAREFTYNDKGNKITLRKSVDARRKR